MIKKTDVIAALDGFMDQQWLRLMALIEREDYEDVSFRSGYVEGLEMAKAIILVTKEEDT